LTGLYLSALQIKTKIVSCHTADSKPVKQEVNSTVILSPLVFPGRLNVVALPEQNVLSYFCRSVGNKERAKKVRLVNLS
jgi:hypothetical protein